MTPITKAAALVSIVCVITACQSKPPLAPKIDIPTEEISVGNFFYVKACISGDNTVSGRSIRGTLCTKSQKYDVFGGPVIRLGSDRRYVGELTPQEAVKGFATVVNGIEYTFKCEERPKKKADDGDSYHCAYDADNLPMIRADITYP